MDVATEGSQGVAVSKAHDQFKTTVQAAIREVHVDVSAFKQRIEQRIDELCVSNGPLAAAVARLEEENLQLRAKLEALSCLVEGLVGVKVERSHTEVKRKVVGESIENGHVQVSSGQIQEEKRHLLYSGRSEESLSSRSTSTLSELSVCSEGSSYAAAVARNTTSAPKYSS